MSLKINHIGIVVKNIDKYIANSMNEEIDIQVYDPAQQAEIAILKVSAGSPAIELIQPDSDKATTYNFLLKTGGGLHHICYEIETEKALKFHLVENKIKPIYGPVPATVFKNRKVLFGYTRNREIVEYLILKNG